MSIGERIKKLRRELDLTQQKFGERVGIKGNTVAQYELGRSNPIDAVVSLICREFNVREEWLRTGEGEMFKPGSPDLLEQLAHKYNLSNAAYVMIKEFIKLKPEAQQAVFDYISNIKLSFEDGELDPLAPANKERGNATPEMTVEEAEAEYIKSRSAAVRKTGLSASNTTSDTDVQNGKEKASGA